MIHGEMTIPDNDTFLKNIISEFNNLEALSFDFDKNKNVISDSILSTLKKLHIFWNVNR